MTGKAFAAAATGAVLALMLFLAAWQRQRWDSDIFWALKSGEWIVENLGVPVSDPFSYTFGGRPWVDFTWGFQVIAWAFYTHLGGWAGLFALQLIATSLTFLFLHLNLRASAPDRPWLSMAAVLLVYGASYSRLFIRPHLFEYLFVSLYLLLLGGYARDGKPWRLYLLFPLQAVWVNVHSSAVLGVFMAAAYAAGGVMDELRANGFRPRLSGGAKRLALAALLLPLAALVNPYGVKLALFPFVHQGAGNADALRHIMEWTRPELRELFFHVFPFPFRRFSFFALAIGAATALILNVRAARSRDFLLLAVSLYMAASHNRWVALAAYFTGPVLVSNLSAYPYRSRMRPIALKAVAITANVLILAALAHELKGYLSGGNLGLGPKHGVFPSDVVGFMKRRGIKGNIYNDYLFGGYLIHEYPEVKVFIDGRTPTVYSPHFFWKSRLFQDDLTRERLVDEYGITTALVRLKSGLCTDLIEDAAWAAVAFDDVSALFLRRVPEFDGIVSKWEMRHVNPCADSGRFRLPRELLPAREELKRLVVEAWDGAGPSRAHRLLGIVDSELGGAHLDEAAVELRKAADISGDPRVLYDLGVVLGKLGRPGDAIEVLNAAVGKDKGFKEARLALGLAYYDAKDYVEAFCHLEMYADSAGDKTGYLAYRALGISGFHVSRFDAAAGYLERAAFIAPESAEAGDIAEVYYYAGNSLIETGDYAGATRYYLRAIAADPGYRAVLGKLAETHRRDGRADESDAIEAALGSGAKKDQ
jgi:tetratricopeptide (TPR) repeat protein